MIIQNGSVTVLKPNQVTGLRRKKGLVPSIRPTDLAVVLGMNTADHQSVLANDVKVSVLDDLFNSDRDYVKTEYYTTMNLCGEISSCHIDKNSSMGVNPVIPIDKKALTDADITTLSNGERCVFYGEFPQTAVGLVTASELNKKLLNDKLKPTGRIFTFFRDNNSQDYEEYIDLENGKKFIRIRAQFFDDKSQLLGDYHSEYKNGAFVWIQVQPIKWIIDEKNGLLIASKSLVSGLKDSIDYYSQFDNTVFSRYLNDYFRSQIITKGHSLEEIKSKYNSELAEKEEEQKEEEKKKYQFKKVNPFGLNFEDVSEEDIIAGAIETGLPVFLHGKSSDGKSARVKEIDPDCITIYLRNATPDTLNGKSIVNEATGEMIDVKPTWLVKLEELCAKEPDKIHLLFFDEISNALPSIQGIAFNIVLDKEVNGKWQLPSNVRVIAAGNEMQDSLAANQIAKPLFNRFAHVYIKTTVDSWLKWAASHHIHPAIYAYIAYRGDNALRTDFSGDKPNADPRKWEMASKMLYEGQSVDSLRALIGEELTKEFMEFCQIDVITLAEVITGKYKEEEINKLNTDERYAEVMALTYVDEINVEKVYNFVKLLGPEYIKVFESIWCNSNERKEIIKNIKEKEGMIK